MILVLSHWALLKVGQFKQVLGECSLIWWHFGPKDFGRSVNNSDVGILASVHHALAASGSHDRWIYVRIEEKALKTHPQMQILNNEKC